MTDLFDRRTLMAMASFGGLAAAFPAGAQETAASHLRGMMAIPENAPKVAMLVHPNMVALDLIAPMSVLRLIRTNIMLAWKDKQPVSTELPFSITPTHSFAEIPRDVDVLFVPGGTMGTVAVMNDPEVLAFLQDRGARAKWVTSVCTGSLTLAAAGLLTGYRATSNWAVAEMLPLMGATRVDERLVVDRNRITGAGPSAGIDFGLLLAEKLQDEHAARRAALILEYAPEPPVHSGTPAQAGTALTSELKGGRVGMDSLLRKQCAIAGTRLKTI